MTTNKINTTINNYNIDITLNNDNGLLIFNVETIDGNKKYYEKINIEDITLPFPNNQKFDIIHNCLISSDDNFRTEIELNEGTLNIYFYLILNGTYCIGSTISLNQEYEIIEVTDDVKDDIKDIEIDNNENNDIKGWDRLDYLEMKCMGLEKEIEYLHILIDKHEKIITSLLEK